MQTVELQRMERGDPGTPQEITPLQHGQLERMTSTEERAERARIADIFRKLDTDRDGYLKICDLKRLIKNHNCECEKLPKGMTRYVMNMYDTNGDGKLDLAEFYELTQAHKWLVKEYIVSYCKWIVPSPHRGEVGDQVDGAYEKQMTFWPPPMTMIIFSLLEIIAFVFDIVYFAEDTTNTKEIGTNTNGPAAVLFIYNPFRRIEAWRFLTYMMVHVGVMHILMNLLIQIFLGIALEIVHCWWRVALVYLAGVVAGSMATSLTSPQIFLAGASGGVYALITAHIATIILNYREMEYGCIQLFVFVIYIGTDIGFSVYRYLTESNSQIGYMAHIGGAVAGLLVGIGVLRNLKPRRCEKYLWWGAVSLYLVLNAIGVFIHIFMPQLFPPQQHTSVII